MKEHDFKVMKRLARSLANKKSLQNILDAGGECAYVVSMIWIKDFKKLSELTIDENAQEQIKTFINGSFQAQ